MKRMVQVKKDMIEQLIALEEDVLYQEYADNQEQEFRYIKGDIPILLSAPHGAAHTRDGRIKEEDEFTAGLARLIGIKTRAHVIYARRKSRTDPNADPKASYKQALLKIVQENKISFVLDLHGANMDKDFGIAIGTMHDKSCSEKEKQIIVKIFEKYGISENGSKLSRMDVDKNFAGTGDENRVTITRFCYQNSIPAAQIEINASLRIPERREDATDKDKDFKGDQERIKNLITVLVDIINLLAVR